MATTDTLRGATNAFTFVFAYINTVGQEIGMEKAIALDAEMCAMMGAAQGQAIKAQAGLGEIDLATAAALSDASIEEGLGIVSEVIEKNAQRIVSRVDRCPLYEAAQMLGMDNATIEAMCRAGALRYMDTMVKQWNPNLSYRLKEFRSSADGHCIEEVVVG